MIAGSDAQHAVAAGFISRSSIPSAGPVFDTLIATTMRHHHAAAGGDRWTCHRPVAMDRAAVEMSGAAAGAGSQGSYGVETERRAAAGVSL